MRENVYSEESKEEWVGDFLISGEEFKIEINRGPRELPDVDLV